MNACFESVASILRGVISELRQFESFVRQGQNGDGEIFVIFSKKFIKLNVDFVDVLNMCVSGVC